MLSPEDHHIGESRRQVKFEHSLVSEVAEASIPQIDWLEDDLCPTMTHLESHPLHDR